MADELAFGGLGHNSFADLQQLSVSEIQYWHFRASEWVKKQARNKRRR